MEAILRGYDLAKELGLFPVNIESDRQAMVDRINSVREDFSLLGHFVNALKEEFRHNEQVCVTYIHRNSNIPAHLPAQHALEFVDFTVDERSSRFCYLILLADVQFSE